MLSNNRTSILLLGFLVFLVFACVGNKSPVSSNNHTYEIAYGTISQVDEYPLYMYTYSADYKFDDYLETGTIPFYASTNTNIKNYACTCFSAFGGDNRLLGRNYDWADRSTYYLVFTDPPDGYASVSTVDMFFFDYYHNESPDYAGNQTTLGALPYYPFDGMNEKGVAVGMNALPRARGPYDADRVTIGELQLIRLVLDYAGSTREAISLIEKYNIRMEDPPIHYLIADSSGHSAIIEFVDGKMEIMENDNPWQVTTNFIISDFDNPKDAGCWRYQTADYFLLTRNGTLSENDALNLLQEVSVSNTRWSVLFNLKTGKLQTAMGRAYNNLHFFTLPNSEGG